MFFLLSLVTGPSLMSTSLLVLELGSTVIQNLFYKRIDQISGGLGELGIPNLARISLIKCY